HGSVDLDVRQIRWRRVMDMNDRALRQIVIGLGGRLMGVPREEGFDITAASEVMAILSLTSGPADLIGRLARIVIGFSGKGKAVKVHGGTPLSEINKPNLTSLKLGMGNLAKHAESAHEYGLRPIVAVNRFAADTEDELKLVVEESRALGLEARVIDVFGQGGE